MKVEAKQEGEVSAAKEAKKKAAEPVAAPQKSGAAAAKSAPTPARSISTSPNGSRKPTRWLAQRNAEPETRQFQLDETDRIQLEQESEEGDAKDKKANRPEKKAPGKLPERPSTAAASSREAAADMLKKFFNNR